ncbi:MAG: VWA domain-containing protein [Phycisphaerales bacterium]|nr:VWA domain-containing protein [Phycisphaerales bacterium]
MTLLSPIAAIIAGAIGAGTLIVLYCLKLRRRPVRVSDVSLWDAATGDLEASVPFRLLRPGLLFLLQLLAIACLALALGRPAIPDSGTGADRTLIVLDLSASMSARINANGSAQPRTRLDLAREEARAIVRSRLSGLSGGGSVAIVGAASEASVLCAWTSDTSIAIDAIERAPASDQPARDGAAIELARIMLADSGEDATPSEVVLLSDDPAQLLGQDAATPAGARVRTIVPGGAVPLDNLGIVALRAERALREPGAVSMLVRVASSNDFESAAALAISLDGVELTRRAIVVPAGGAVSERIDANIAGGGTVEARIERPDALESDNAAWGVLSAPGWARVALVQPDATARAEGESDASWIVRDVLEAMDLAELRVLSPTEAIDPNTLTGVDIIVFDRVAPARMPDTPCVVLGEGIAGVVRAIAPEDPDASRRVLIWDREHPATRSLSFDGVLIDEPRVLTPVGSVPMRELARVGGGVAIAEVAGRAIVVAFDVTRSTWPLRVDFPVFLAASIDALAGTDESRIARMFRTDEVVRRPPTMRSGSINLRGPRGSNNAETTGEIEIGTDAPDLGVLPRVGVYAARSASAEASIAVNLLDERESDLRIRTGASPTNPIVGDARDADARGVRELWWWFTLAGAVLLSIEWVAYVLRARL